jgi:CheY-like chemotaxis protein
METFLQNVPYSSQAPLFYRIIVMIEEAFKLMRELSIQVPMEKYLMDVEPYTISFSATQPETFLAQLLALLQAEMSQPEISVVRSSLNVLIIDANKVRADVVASLVNAAGYTCVTAVNALDAFTLFLKGSYIPLAIVLGQERVPDPLFLQRLLQQTMQKYQLKTPVVRLIHEPTSIDVSRHPSQPLRHPSQPLPQFSPSDYPPQTGTIEQIEREKIILTGQTTGRYHLDTLLGGGLQGSVYRAYDRLREQDIAFKAMQVSTMPYFVIRVSAEDTNLFEQEYELLAQLKHDHILVPLNTGRSYISGSSFVFKTMPYFPERSLALWLSRHGQKEFSPQEIVPLILQLADALQCVHDHQIVYQNFKLSNLLIRNQNNDIRKLHIMLADFPITQDGSFFSNAPETLPYMAPERWSGQALPASDQYALAAIAYELLVSRPPFQGGSEYAMRFLHLNMQPQAPTTFRPNLPPAVNHVLLRGLAKRPEDRFPTVAAFAKALQRYCG